MKNTLLTIVAAAACVAMTSSAMAYSTNGERQGVFLGGGAAVGAEVGPLNAFGGGAQARLGYGVNDNVLVYLDNNYFYAKDSGVNFNFFDTEAKVQYFPVGGFFLAGGGGLSFGRASVARTGTKTGYTTSYTAGYEFRPKENVGITLESGYRYRRIKGTNFHSPLATIRGDLYF